MVMKRIQTTQHTFRCFACYKNSSGKIIANCQLGEEKRKREKDRKD